MTPPTKPLTKGEVEEAEKKARETKDCYAGGPSAEADPTVMADNVLRMGSDLRAMRELLERAYEKSCTNDGFDDPPCDPKCEGCTWNAERKRALDGWEGK